jgi:hypothetical protein
MLFEATMFPGLASSRSSNVWAKMRRTESSQIANLPGPTATGPQITGELRTELQSLTTDVTRMSAAYDLINARHYRAAIDDWWAHYPQAQVFPVLAGGYRETLLAELPRGEITPTHLQMGDVMAQRQRRLGWAAQAEVDAVAIALRERLDRERVTFESQLSTELTSRLSKLELGNSTVVSGPQITAHTILSSGGSLPPLSLSTQFADMLATHALQMPATTSRDLMATSAAETTALKNLWESYDALRERRIDAALRGQHLTEGSGPDMTDQVGSQLFPKISPTPVEVAP